MTARWTPAVGDLVRISDTDGISDLCVVVEAGPLVTARFITPGGRGPGDQRTVPAELVRRAVCRSGGCRYPSVAWWYPRAEGNGVLGLPEPLCDRCAKSVDGQVHRPAEAGGGRGV